MKAEPKGKLVKLEIRCSAAEKRAVYQHCADAGYTPTGEFSVWARRVLQGIEPHPNLKKCAAKRVARK